MGSLALCCRPNYVLAKVNQCICQQKGRTWRACQPACPLRRQARRLINPASPSPHQSWPPRPPGKSRCRFTRSASRKRCPSASPWTADSAGSETLNAWIDPYSFKKGPAGSVVFASCNSRSSWAAARVLPCRACAAPEARANRLNGAPGSYHHPAVGGVLDVALPAPQAAAQLSRCHNGNAGCQKRLKARLPKGVTGHSPKSRQHSHSATSDPFREPGVQALLQAALPF